MHFRSAAGSLGSRRAAVLCLAIAVCASGVLLLSLDSHLTFIADDWGLLLRRRDWALSAFLDPYGEHLILGTAIVFKAMQELFGMSSSLPYYCVAISLFLTSAVLLFLYLRSRVGDWLALIGAVLILFLGAAFEDMLWVSTLNFYGSMVAGLGMLLALDRDDARGDRIACVLLAVSIAFSSVGLAFAAGALVDLAFGRRPRGSRAYVVAVPLALFAVWWLGWGHNAKTHAAFNGLDSLPKFAFHSAAAGFTSLFGLATGDGSEPSQPHLIWGEIALGVVAVLVVARIAQLRRVPRGLAIVLAIAFTFWVLTGLLPGPLHPPTASRYQFMSAIFLLLIVAETIRGLRVPELAVVVTAVVAGLAVAGGISLLHRQYTERWRPFADSTRYYLAAVEIAGDSADPTFRISFPPTLNVYDRTYLDTVRRYGSPAYGETKLAAADPTARAAADLTIAQALGLALASPQPSTRTLGCQPLQASATGETGLTLLHGGFTFDNRSDASVEVMLSRFADEPSVDLGPLGAGVKTSLQIPSDESTRPWNLSLRGEGPVRLCTTVPA